MSALRCRGWRRDVENHPKERVLFKIPLDGPATVRTASAGVALLPYCFHGRVSWKQILK
jgi:hypothetical protein